MSEWAKRNAYLGIYLVGLIGGGQLVKPGMQWGWAIGCAIAVALLHFYSKGEGN